MSLHVADHPLIAQKMTLLRDADTKSIDFRRLVKEITFYLGYEASRSLQLSKSDVTTPMGMTYNGSIVTDNVCIIPILRAGLSMSEGMMELLPEAAVHHIGMYRTAGSLLPVQYYNRLPRDHNTDVAIICDPCIATSNTLQAACSIVKRWGAKKIIIVATLASRAGVEKLQKAHPDVEIFVAQVDEELSEEGMILPGIGDAGDRLFDTPSNETEGTSGKKRKH